MASQLLGPELGALLADYEWGFRRRERLDVKKPGPPFDKNNHLFKTDQNNNTKPAGKSMIIILTEKIVDSLKMYAFQ